ncbi:hypothetical protein M378DRAFT_167378 [Amanita muscaria Koide BX008]|uniref:Uncharacterized protein n=1 Tax=Amanita muscaria (strain Koide BX008) TaxID=946122 RepID=A0A0C2T3H7_AMAMK|nr:hypothetical protein M378DRAFT_167378 [Amanita muscaria Koide BX008]
MRRFRYEDLGTRLAVLAQRPVQGIFARAQRLARIRYKRPVNITVPCGNMGVKYCRHMETSH